MKKRLLFVAAIFAATASFAQDGPTSKKGYKFLPEAGDWALGTSADPFIRFSQNLLNFANNTGVKVDGFDASDTVYVDGFKQTIVGKYFVSEKKAIRIGFHINTQRKVTKTFGDNPLTPSAPANTDVIELQKNAVGKYDWYLSAGMEYRRGHNKLQGFYGWEVALGFANDNKVKNTYGVEYNQQAEDSGYVAAGDSRVLSQKGPLQFRAGLRGFIGVEYFFIPKMSVGMEFGWGVAYTKDFGRGKTETEYWGIDPTVPGATEETAYTTETEGTTQKRTTGFSVDRGTGNMLDGTSSRVRLLFHF